MNYGGTIRSLLVYWFEQRTRAAWMELEMGCKEYVLGTMNKTMSFTTFFLQQEQSKYEIGKLTMVPCKLIWVDSLYTVM
jgi:hypothetical protein